MGIWEQARKIEGQTECWSCHLHRNERRVFEYVIGGRWVHFVICKICIPQWLRDTGKILPCKCVELVEENKNTTT